MTPTYIISDYLRPSIDKFLYLLNASGKEQYVHSFIVARRNWKILDQLYLELVIMTILLGTELQEESVKSFLPGRLGWNIRFRWNRRKGKLIRFRSFLRIVILR